MFFSPKQGLQNTSDMEAKKMLMSFCATQWMLCKSPVYLEQSEFPPFPNLVGINFLCWLLLTVKILL